MTETLTGFGDTAAGYEGVDATGKIVLVNWGYGDYWVNRHGHQATLEGALAVIFYTGTTAGGAYFNMRDEGLLSFDGTYDDDWVPFVFVTRNAANDLPARIAAGPTTVNLISNVELTRAKDGGVGYNVLGSIRGSDRSDELIIFTGHHDAWFRGAADDATAVAAMLAIGKAVRETGLRPRREVADPHTLRASGPRHGEAVERPCADPVRCDLTERRVGQRRPLHAHRNFDYLRQNLEVVNDIWVDHDRSSLPLLDFVARAVEAETRVAYQTEPGVSLADLPGVDTPAVERLSSAVAAFRSAAEAWTPCSPRPVLTVRRWWEGPCCPSSGT